MKKQIAVCMILLGIAWAASAYSAADPDQDMPRKLIFFHSVTCHRCITVKSDIIPLIEERFRDRIQIEYRDIGDIENYKLLLGLARQKGRENVNVPVFYFEGALISDDASLLSTLINTISQALTQAPGHAPQAQPIDLIERFRRFEPWAVAGAGLVDGINPCAFTVIVFFISFLALQGYVTRELALIGGAFIGAVFLTYLALGVGMFSFLYTMRSFWMFTRIFNVAVGVFSVGLGCLALYDFLIFKKTKETGGMLLQLPASVKNQIHAVIGMHYRVQPRHDSSHPAPRPLLRLVGSALVSGFLVSLLEAVCTGQVYLPTITFVLKTSSHKVQALEYLVLYNLMFCLPLVIIFCLALFGATSAQFAHFLKKHLSTVKIAIACLFFGLGIFLIWKG